MRQFFLFWMLLGGQIWVQAQSFKTPIYHVKIVTTEAKRFSGYLFDVTDTDLVCKEYDVRRGMSTWSYTIPLTKVRKIIVRIENKNSAIWKGALVGGVTTGFLAAKSLEKYPTKSPILSGVTLTFSGLAGAGIGGVMGGMLAGFRRKVIRVTQPIEHPEGLRFRLMPYTYLYNLGNRKKLVNPILSDERN
ncbi:MAG: hypothetical protein U0Y10_05640 [Spirosomataceae bacterium]